MGWKMAQQLIWTLLILCVIFSTFVVPGSTGYISPSQEPFSLITTLEESAVGDGPTTAPQSNGFPQPPLKSPAIVQTIKGSAPVLAPSESATVPPHDSAPQLPLISPHASAPPPPVLAVLPHASTPPPPFLEVPPTSASPPLILKVPPHAFIPSPPIQAVPPHAPALPPPIPPDAPLASPPILPMLEVPPHASALPPPIVEVPPHAFAPSPPIPLEAPPVSAPFPPILEVPPHASAPSPPILKMPPHASALPQSIPAIPPHTSTPPSQIPLEPPFASAPPLPMIETPPLVVASPPPAPLHISTPPPPILTKSPLAYTPSSPTLEVPPHASTPPSPILEVPPHVSTPPSPILVVPPNAPSPPSPNLIVQPPSAPLPPIQAMPPPTAPPPPILKVSPPASTPPPSILPEAPLSSEPSPPVLEVPPHDSTSPPPILPEAPFAFAPPPPILEVPPHASTPLSHALPKHAPPPLFGIAVPPNVSAPPHNSIPSPSSVQPNMSAQPPQGTPIPASPPIPVRVLPPVSDSIPSHDALPESPSIPPVSLPLLSPGSVPPHTLHPPSSPMAPQAFAQSPSGLPTRPLSPVSSAVPPLPNALAPSHHALPQAHAMPPRLSPPPPGSPGLPTRALSPASSVVSPPPNSLAPSHHSLPQAPSMPPRVLSLPPPGSPPPVSAPSVHSMPPSLPLSPLVRPFPPTQPPSRLPKKASSPPPFMVSKPPNISSTSNKSRPLQPTMSPLGSSQPPPGLSVQVSAPTPSVLPLTQNVSAPPHNFSPASPTVPPHASAQPPSAPAIMPTPINISPPPMNVVRQHAQTPKPVAVSLSPQASSAPGSPKSSVASTPPASVVDQQNAPSVSPLTSRNQSQYGRHKASPAVASAPGFSPRSAPSALNSTIHTNSAPGIPAAALPSPETSPSKSYSSPVTSPSNSNVKHHYARKKRSSPAPETSGGFENPPLYAPQPVNQHTQPSPRHAGSSEVNIPSPSPSAMENIILAPPPSMIASSGHSEIPIVSPKISPSRASINNPKRPLAAPIIALPPPPPNEDCAYLTCTEPLTNTPPGSPCGCVYPMQVRLRLSVDLYTFFPLVLELAREIAAGVFMKQSQVRIMGANAAIQQPEKTDVLIDLVPLGEKFDYVTAFLTFQRFWHKQISIDKSRFGSYEVLYVHYPGLPPSPPVASSDMAVINGDPSSGQGGSDIHPLAVDVPGQRHKHGLSGGLIAVIVFSAVAALVLCLSIAWVVLVKRRKNLPEQPISHAQISSLTRHSVHSGGSGPSSAPLSLESSIAAYTGSAKTFSLSEIEKATDNFNPSKVLGEGGFGLVYSGILEDGTKIAVKVLKRDDQQGGREFLAEVEMLSRLHHRNLVKLIGICVEERTRCLVYELVPNGSVDSHLHGMDKETSSLEWDIRMKIALGAARGLAYLHEDSSPRVIHRDFKASNILLENDFTPKVSDFGLARTGMEEESKHISTRVMGTFGYVAPEYAMTGHLLVKSDVYSYGVVLLELLTGRKPVDMSQPPGQENLVAWTRPLLTSKEGLESIIDPSLGPNISYNSIAKVAAIASMCVQPEVSHRPFMGEVVQALKLVCHECEDAKDDEESTRTSCSHENLSPDFDPRMSPVSGEMLNPSQSELMIHSYVSGHDPEKGVSVSNIFSASERVGRQVCGSSRRHSASGPVRVGRRDRWFWHKTRSRGSISENGVMHKFWSGSH